MYEQQLPLMVTFSFSDRATKKNHKLNPSVPADDYDIFILKTGDIFLYNVEFEESFKTMQLFITKLIEGAKLPKTLSYNNAMQLFCDALVGTGIKTKLGVSATALEFLLSELFRDKNNLHNEFRFAYNGKNEFDYRMCRITKIPELSSVFTGITGEDINTQFINAVARTRERKPDKYSPLEKILKY